MSRPERGPGVGPHIGLPVPVGAQGDGVPSAGFSRALTNVDVGVATTSNQQPEEEAIHGALWHLEDLAAILPQLQPLHENLHRLTASSTPEGRRVTAFSSLAGASACARSAARVSTPRGCSAVLGPAARGAATGLGGARRTVRAARLEAALRLAPALPSDAWSRGFKASDT
eukprot:CAMPEP_0204326436 /NCGR_PEP_ID=MMETSP0469-20131031/11824_1 /ASSEMBLY_ACC=CAM_ASM_000384 /TAXON_ID=2969 /ORGANISM="Oxyrrhis marina" /LENGTH=170 /DNA_ID=CAMNT_0051308489 /DNA_START=41 /DNA_END=551 /DNA_ORIENTATION=+